ncbi:MAG: hypothetical protein RL268_2204, partial [Pseudomonadota bacterium]
TGAKEIGFLDMSIPEEFRNREIAKWKASYKKRVIDKKAKSKGRRVLEDVEEPAAASRGSNVIDLMAALKASVDEKPRSAAKESKSKAKSAPKSSASRKRA